MNRTTSIPNSQFRVVQFIRWAISKEILIVSIVLITLILLFFSPTLIQGKLPMSSSYILRIYPWAHYRDQFKADVISNNILSDEYDSLIPMMEFFRTEVHQGEYPLWNPYVNSGMPDGLLFIYDNFSVNRLLTLLVGTKWGSLLYMFVKLYVVGIFFYLYLRYRRFSWPAALSGSLVLMFSANMIANTMRDTVDAVVYAPAILYFAERFARERKYRYYVGLIFATGVTIISGFPSIIMYTLILVGMYLTYRILLEIDDRPFQVRFLNLLWIYSALGLGIAWVMFTLLPTYEYFQYINLGYREGRGTTILEYITAGRLINPNICGNPIKQLWFCSGNYNESALYVGLLPLFLIPFGITNKHHKSTALFFAGFAFLVLMTIFGAGNLHQIVGSFPLFNINPNIRMIALLPICFAFITAAGMDNLLGINNKARFLYLLYFLLLMLCALYVFRTVPLALANEKENIDYFLNQRLITFLLLISYSSSIMAVIVYRKAVLSFATIILIVLNFVERSALLGGYHGASYPENFYPETSATSFLKTEMSDYERIVVIGRHFVPSLPLYYSINSLTGHWHASVEFKQNMELISPGVYNRDTTQPIFSSDSIKLLSPLLDLYRARYIVTSPRDAPLWYEVLADQKEYNDIYELDKINSFGQSVTIIQDGYGERLEIRLSIPDIESIPAHIRIFDNNQLEIEIDELLIKQNSGWYAANLPKIPLKKGQVILFEITLMSDNLPQKSRLHSVDFDIYEDGSLLIDRKEMAGDIAFNLTQYNSGIADKFELVHFGDLNIYANRAVSNRIPVVSKLQYSNKDSCASTLAQVDPFQVAVVDDPNLDISGVNTGSVATIREMSVNSIVIDAEVRNTDSMVILSDTYYPGWSAKVDGVEAKIHRINCNMRGVIVPPGSHTIIMSYQPLSFKIGLGISLLSVVILIVVGKVFVQKRNNTQAS